MHYCARFIRLSWRHEPLGCAGCRLLFGGANLIESVLARFAVLVGLVFQRREVHVVQIVPVLFVLLVDRLARPERLRALADVLSVQSVRIFDGEHKVVDAAAAVAGAALLDILGKRAKVCRDGRRSAQLRLGAHAAERLHKDGRRYGRHSVAHQLFARLAVGKAEKSLLFGQVERLAVDVERVRFGVVLAALTGNDQFHVGLFGRLDRNLDALALNDATNEQKVRLAIALCVAGRLGHKVKVLQSVVVGNHGVVVHAVDGGALVLAAARQVTNGVRLVDAKRRITAVVADARLDLQIEAAGVGHWLVVAAHRQQQKVVGPLAQLNLRNLYVTHEAGQFVVLAKVVSVLLAAPVVANLFGTVVVKVAVLRANLLHAVRLHKLAARRVGALGSVQNDVVAFGQQHLAQFVYFLREGATHVLFCRRQMRNAQNVKAKRTFGHCSGARQCLQ